MNVQELTLFLNGQGLRPTSYQGTHRLAYSGEFYVCNQPVQIILVFPSLYPTDFPIAFIKDWETNYEFQKNIYFFYLSKLF